MLVQTGYQFQKSVVSCFGRTKSKGSGITFRIKTITINPEIEHRGILWDKPFGFKPESILHIRKIPNPAGMGVHSGQDFLELSFPGIDLRSFDQQPNNF